MVRGHGRADRRHDLVDEATPYVWTRWLEDGSLHYIIVGGTPEDYGWAEGSSSPEVEGAAAALSTAGRTSPGRNLSRTRTGMERGLSQVEELFKE